MGVERDFPDHVGLIVNCFADMLDSDISQFKYERITLEGAFLI